MVIKGHSISTVGIYLRNLRHIFNRAIKSNDIPQALYPFGAHEESYTIPAGRNITKALSIEEIKQIKQLDIDKDLNAQKARDFWLLIFYCNGVNLNDLLRWKHSMIFGGKVSFVRGKSKSSKRTLSPTTITLIPEAIEIIETYKTDRDGEDFLFPVLSISDSPKEKRLRTSQGLSVNT
jgi:integrase/recombinase XerD